MLVEGPDAERSRRVAELLSSRRHAWSLLPLSSDTMTDSVGFPADDGTNVSPAPTESRLSAWLRRALTWAPGTDGRLVLIAALVLYLLIIVAGRVLWRVDVWPWLGVPSGPSILSMRAISPRPWSAIGSGTTRSMTMSVSGFHHHFKSRHLDEPPAIPEADPAARGSTLDARRRPETRRAPGTAWATRTRRTSAASTRGSSARHRSATSRGSAATSNREEPRPESENIGRYETTVGFASLKLTIYVVEGISADGKRKRLAGERPLQRAEQGMTLVCAPSRDSS